MARSVGEAAAQSLESGFRLAMDVAGQRRAEKRQERLDAQAEEDRQRTITRQGAADKLAALSAQEQMLAAEGAGLAAGDTPPDEATQADFARRAGGVRTAKQQLLAQTSGYDIEGTKQAGLQALEALKTGDFAALRPGQFTQALTVATGRPPADYIRADGKPSAIEQGMADFAQGMESGDRAALMRGLNVLLAKELRTGVGQPSPHGGRIVGKRVVDLALDPTSPKESPRVIPTLEVFVDGGKEFRGPRQEGVPEGATGSYKAPVTLRRSTDPNDPVRSIGIDQAMEYFSKQLELAQAMNSPEALRQIQLDQEQGGWNPQEYLQALSGLGIRPPEKKVQQHVIPAGGTLATTVTDKLGNVRTSLTSGTPKAETMLEVAKRLAEEKGTDVADELIALRGKKPTAVQEALKLVEDGKAKSLEEAMAIVRPSKASLALAGKGGAAGGGKKLAGSMTDKEIGRRLQYVKEQRLALDKKRDVVMAEYKAAIQDGTKKEKAAAKAEMDAKLSKLDSEDEGLRRNMDKLERQLDLGDDERPPLAKTEPAAGRNRLKFDKSGNLVSK